MLGTKSIDWVVIDNRGGSWGKPVGSNQGLVEMGIVPIVKVKTKVRSKAAIKSRLKRRRFFNKRKRARALKNTNKYDMFLVDGF